MQCLFFLLGLLALTIKPIFSRYDDRKKESYEVKAHLWPFAPMVKKRKSGFERYTEEYPVASYNFVVGINRENRHLVRHNVEPTTGTGFVFVGNDDSGMDEIVFGQMFKSFCEQRAGVMFIDPGSEMMIEKAKSIMNDIGREDSLFVVEAAEISEVEPAWWSRVIEERKVAIVQLKNEDGNCSEKPLRSLLKALSDNEGRAPSSDRFLDAPFLCFSDKIINSSKELIDEVEKARRKRGVTPFVMIKDPSRFMDSKGRDFLNYFSHKFIMKIRSPDVAKRVVDSVSLGNSVNAEDVINHNPGEASYIFNGLGWKRVSLVYLG
jgi:hypothetical protein